MKKILIIDDEIENCFPYIEFLKKKNLEILTANNGATGIQKAFSEMPDLILCDINMPEMDGYQVLSILKKNLLTESIPIIFVTGMAGESNIRDGVILGADDYIIKPISNNESLYLSIVIKLDKQERITKKYFETIFTIFGNSLLPICIIDEQFKLFYANPNFLMLTEYNKEHLLNSLFVDLILEADKNVFNEKMILAKRGIQGNEANFRILLKNQQILAILIRIGIIYIDRKKYYILEMVETDSSKKIKKQFRRNFDDAINVLVENQNKLDKELIQELKEIFQIHTDESIVNISPDEKLSKRELEVLKLLVKSMTNFEIAENMGISTRTVEKHRMSLMAKFNAKNTIDMIVKAIKSQIIRIA
jgi:PAS domain S-box-containing protein